MPGQFKTAERITNLSKSLRKQANIFPSTYTADHLQLHA